MKRSLQTSENLHLSIKVSPRFLVGGALPFWVLYKCRNDVFTLKLFFFRSGFGNYSFFFTYFDVVRDRL